MGHRLSGDCEPRGAGGTERGDGGERSGGAATRSPKWVEKSGSVTRSQVSQTPHRSMHERARRGWGGWRSPVCLPVGGKGGLE